MNLDPDKLIVLFVIAMLVLGPKRLPEAARTAGRWMAEVRKYTMSWRSELRDLLDEPGAEGRGVREELREAFAEPRRAIEAGAREMRTGLHPEAGAEAPSGAQTGADSAAQTGAHADVHSGLLPGAGEALPSWIPSDGVPAGSLPVPDDPNLN